MGKLIPPLFFQSLAMPPASFTSSNISPTTPYPPALPVQPALPTSATPEESLNASPQQAIPNPNPAAQRRRVQFFMQPLPSVHNTAEVASPEASPPKDKAKLAYAKEFIQDVLSDLYKRTVSAPGSDIPQDGSWKAHLFKFHHPLITLFLNSLIGEVGGHIQGYEEFRKYNDFKGWGEHVPEFATDAAKIRALGIGAASAVLMELAWSVKNVIAERRKNLQPSNENQQEAGQSSFDVFDSASFHSDSFIPPEFRGDIPLEGVPGPSNLSPDVLAQINEWAETSGHNARP